MGLAKIALAGGEKEKALQLFRQALSKEWPAQEEPLRRTAQFDYATLLSDTGRPSEAIALLLTMIEQRGDDPAAGKRAADTVKAIGSPEQAEEAYTMLASHFPADSSVWLRLGDARFAADKDRLALDAYRRAAKADPENTGAQSAVTRVEDVLSLDPTRRGLSVRERARRWDVILQRVVAAAAACGESPETEKAKPLLKKRTFSLGVSDQKMDAALRVWQSAVPSCKTDAVLSHVMSKVRE
jgi:tetratricopeptide (TPR) repeat protein